LHDIECLAPHNIDKDRQFIAFVIAQARLDAGLFEDKRLFPLQPCLRFSNEPPTFELGHHV
jgi:hypothetical protein